MAGILVVRRYPGYKDVPGELYHYPKARYHSQIEALKDRLVVFYEPRRGGKSPDSATGGRMAFTGFAFLEGSRPDPHDATHAYAAMRYYLPFVSPVPLSATTVPAKSLEHAVRTIPYAQAERIIQAGLFDEQIVAEMRTGLVDTADIKLAADRPTSEFVVRRPIRDALFRYHVIERAYDGRCAFTGVRMTNGSGRAEVDAAHIRGVKDGGPDAVPNGLALMKSIHWAFDRGLVSLSDEGRILSVERGIDEPVRRMFLSDGFALLPASPELRPHPAFLTWHREHVFKGVSPFRL